jgi:hypothetical protein
MAIEMPEVTVYDNEGRSLDCYTVVIQDKEWREPGSKYKPCLGLNGCPGHPQMGISMFSECLEGPHLGKRIAFDELPEEVQRHVRARLTED